MNDIENINSVSSEISKLGNNLGYIEKEISSHITSILVFNTSEEIEKEWSTFQDRYNNIVIHNIIGRKKFIEVIIKFISIHWEMINNRDKRLNNMKGLLNSLSQKIKYAEEELGYCEKKYKYSVKGSDFSSANSSCQRALWVLERENGKIEFIERKRDKWNKRLDVSRKLSEIENEIEEIRDMIEEVFLNDDLLILLEILLQKIKKTGNKEMYQEYSEYYEMVKSECMENNKRKAKGTRRLKQNTIESSLKIFNLKLGEFDINVLRKIYKKLILQNHPDIGGNNDIMASINTAYQELKDLC